jgi:hypothetical protein
MSRCEALVRKRKRKRQLLVPKQTLQDDRVGSKTVVGRHVDWIYMAQKVGHSRAT